ncbi:MAG TPA: hypothetical protein VGQ39_07070 [Pyrinomonadaceae bacterium]|nr:hypothetical protein [Pyrinomonadaceae bacterium]
MTKNHIPQNLQIWIDARKRHHLSHAQIQMARELGMNPQKFGKLDNHRQERWKRPLPQFIEHLYLKHFGKSMPDRVVSIEQCAKEIKQKKEDNRVRKAEQVIAKEDNSRQIEDTIPF